MKIATFAFIFLLPLTVVQNSAQGAVTSLPLGTKEKIVEHIEKEVMSFEMRLVTPSSEVGGKNSKSLCEVPADTGSYSTTTSVTAQSEVGRNK